jgi:short-subunit dehydrogenase
MDERDENTLMGKVIVITGASSGFGKGAARRFARAGASVVLAARRGRLLQELQAECEDLGGSSLAVATDVSRMSDVERLFEKTLEEFGRIDVWVNDAGVGAIGPFEKVPLKEHQQVVMTNLMGTLYGSYFAYRQFLRQGSGILINIASELGRHSVPSYTSYTAAKHGVVGLSDSLRQELEANDIRAIHICTVMPTAHDTPFFDHAANHTGREVKAPEPLHDPEHVVETLYRLVLDPKDREIVGRDGIVKILMESIAPKMHERKAARQMHEQQMERQPPAPETSGAVFTPMPEGTGVSAGRNAEREH